MKTKVVKKDITNYLATTKDEREELRNRWYQRKFQLTRKRQQILDGKQIGKGYTLEQIDELLKKNENRIKMLRGKGPGRPPKATVTNVTA